MNSKKNRKEANKPKTDPKKPGYNASNEQNDHPKMIVKCTLPNGTKKNCAITPNPAFSVFVAELKKQLNLSYIDISYLDSDQDEIQIENQSDLNNALTILNGALSVIIKEDKEPISTPVKKIKICSEFSRTGKCSYGEKCRYVHKEKERKAPHVKKEHNEKKKELPEYIPFNSDKGIIFFLQKKVRENPTPDTLVSKMTILQLEDILSRELPNEAIIYVLGLFTCDSILNSVLKEESNKIYSLLLNSKFMETLRKFLSHELPTIENAEPLVYVIKLFRELLQRFSTAYKDIPIESLSGCCQELGQLVPDDIFPELVLLNDMWKDQRNRDKAKFSSNEAEEILYMNVPLFPTKEEFTEEAVGKLPVNLTSGKFLSGLHYLDVNYRLLREDCIRPLREGIKALTSKQKTQDVKVYQDVQVCGLQCHPRLGVVYQISFTSKFKINFARSKRLITGSLLCISPDNFETLLWATVAERKTEDLEKNRISIRFPNGFESNFKIGVTYEMAESSSAYFEAYRYVLKGLQEMDPFSIPFADYFVNAQKNIAPPRYIQEAENMDFSCVFDNLPKIDKWHPERDQWPDIETSMDQSQLQSLKLALTKEVTLIQGPPGTGKTFVGLSIAKMLLGNFGAKRGPILVICFTNHALDQFLEGIYNFEKNIVRVGGRSQSEIMKQRNITELERNLSKKTKDSKKIWDIRKGMEEVEREIHSCIAELNRKLTIDKLHGIASEHQIEELVNAKKGNSLDFWIQKQKKAKVVKNKAKEEEKDNVNQFDLLAEEVDEQEMKELEEEIQLIEQTDDQNTKSKTVEITLEEETDDQVFEPDDNLDQAINLLQMPKQHRMILYEYWTQKYRESIKQKLEYHSHEYELLSKKLREYSSHIQLQVLQQAAVIGMTTTCAARSHDMLVALGAKVVIVEEAAEILEAHILTALTPSTEHLILIGDHLQLRPSVAVDALARKNNLNISLFERLINNELPHTTLSRQRRMRPEFSRLILPLYPKLQSHEAVTKYPNVKGISHNLFFIDHKNQETHSNDIKSYSNLFEAEYVCKLARYFMIQGYAPQNVTILTTYVGQLLKIKEFSKKIGLGAARMCTVDNYQGEENEIVLLSLVRSNSEKKAGFIKIDNRACVALSRAKVGFYVIGNFEMFASVSKFWKSVFLEVKTQQSCGPSLNLVCQQHRDKNTKITTINDFNNVADGGCNLPCTFRLGCGHVCPKRCHPDSHDDYACLKKCEKTGPLCNPPRSCNHGCKRFCSQECGPCKEKVAKLIPSCNHQDQVPCSQDVATWSCTRPCDKLLPCGTHKCSKKCGEKCKTVCSSKVTRRLPCGHAATMECHEDPNQFPCPEPCKELLECEHPCGGTCGTCSENHVPCKSKCGRMLICSHECVEPCTKNCPPCSKKCENACVHSKCQRKCGESCVPCKEPCPWQCEHIKCELLCSDICTRARCNEGCKKKLKCGHNCIGLCGEPCPPICRECDPINKAFEILFGEEDEPDAKFVVLQDCGHVFEYGALDTYMDAPPSSNNIQLKRCPLPDCKAPIRKCFRYANSVKQTLEDIEAIKKTIILQQEKYIKLVAHLKTVVEAHKKTVSSDKFLTSYTNTIAKRLERLLTETELVLVQRQLAIIPVLHKYNEEMVQKKQGNTKIVETFFEETKELMNEMKSITISEEKFEQLKLQLEKSYVWAVMAIILDHQTDGKTITQLRMLQTKLSKTPLTSTLISELKIELKKLDVIISVEEKEQIVKAIGLGKGHWFKCPNGHFYAIGECGGAMETAKCFCGAAIGGGQHALLSTNSHAPEMDNSSHAAWSEANNMANFDPRQFD